MNAPDIQAMSLFTTPLGLVVLPDAETINEALGAIIISQIPAARGPGIPWQWEDGFRQIGGPALGQILEATHLLANRMTAPGGGAWQTTCRADVLEQNQSLPVHAHAGTVWSATYIVDDGGAADQPDLGGAIEFQDPRGSEPVMYAPGLTFAVPGGETLGISQAIVPAPGLLVVFPAWLLQGVAVYRGDGKRVSISIELAIDGAPAG